MKKIILLLATILMCTLLLVMRTVSFNTQQKEITVQRNTSTWKVFANKDVRFSYPDAWHIEISEYTPKEWGVQLYNYSETESYGEVFKGNDIKVSIYVSTSTDQFYSDPPFESHREGSKASMSMIGDIPVQQRFFTNITSYLIPHPANKNLFLNLNMYHAEGNHTQDWIVEEIIRSIIWL